MYVRGWRSIGGAVTAHFHGMSLLCHVLDDSPLQAMAAPGVSPQPQDMLPVQPSNHAYYKTCCPTNIVALL